MLFKDKIISIFCLIDDILHGIEHKEDISHAMEDAAFENPKEIKF